MRPTNTSPNLKNELMNFAVRVGNIFSNISILAIGLCLCSLLSFSAVFIVVMGGLLLIVLSVGTIFVFIPDYFDKLMSATEIPSQVAGFFLSNIGIFVAMAVTGALVSFILLRTDKREKHVARTVISGIVLTVSLIFIILSVR